MSKSPDQNESASAPEPIEHEQAAGNTAEDGDAEITFTLMTDRGPMSPAGIKADPELLAMVRQMLAHADDMPHEVRKAIAAELGLDLETVIAEEAVTAAGESAVCSAHSKTADALARIWDILDEAFPNEPHLWSAGEALLTVSALMPATPSPMTTFSVLKHATTHLSRHAASLNLTPSTREETDEEAIVRRFRQQLDGL